MKDNALHGINSTVQSLLTSISKNLKGKELANWKFQRYMRDYMKTVKSLDDNVGRVLDYLKEKGLLDNTLVVYTSDQGFYMGEHGWFDKRFMYEESMRTPLVMRLPKGSTVEEISPKWYRISTMHPLSSNWQEQRCHRISRESHLFLC